MFFFARARKATSSVLRGNLLTLGIICLLYSEASAARGAAPLDDEAAFVAGHAREKSVNTPSFGLFGLIGSFHDLAYGL